MHQLKDISSSLWWLTFVAGCWCYWSSAPRYHTIHFAALFTITNLEPRSSQKSISYLFMSLLWMNLHSYNCCVLMTLSVTSLYQMCCSFKYCFFVLEKNHEACLSAVGVHSCNALLIHEFKFYFLSFLVVSRVSLSVNLFILPFEVSVTTYA